MKKPILNAIFLLLATVNISFASDADLKKITQFVHFPESISQMSMKVMRNNAVQSEYGMKVYKLDSNRMRIEFFSPEREKGRKILRIGDKIWMYLPDLGKPIVVSARQSFLGSSFSNGDLLRTDYASDYSSILLRTETYQNTTANIYELKAKSNDVAYDRILLWTDAQSLRPLKQEFFTLSGKRLKVLTYSQPINFGGEVNSVMRVDSDLTPDEFTVITLTTLSRKQKLSNALFQKDALVQ